MFFQQVAYKGPKSKPEDFLFRLAFDHEKQLIRENGGGGFLKIGAQAAVPESSFCAALLWGEEKTAEIKEKALEDIKVGK